jgi:hypothetical protein
VCCCCCCSPSFRDPTRSIVSHVIQSDDPQALLSAIPSTEEEVLLRQAAQGREDGELFSRALMFAGARQQLTVIDTLMSFPLAAAALAQSCGVIIR